VAVTTLVVRRFCVPGRSRSTSRLRPTARSREGARVIALANQKGGVAKTTTVASLGSAFAEQGLRVLLVDLDPQSSLTFSLGLDPDAVEPSIGDVLLAGLPMADVVHATDDGVDLVPSTVELAGAEPQLLGRPGREFVLREALTDVLPSYDVVLLDCSPSLGVLTLNALTAAKDVIVPVQCEMLSHRGVGQLLDTIADVQRILNKDLTVLGLLPTMYDGRTTHARAILADLETRYELPVLEPAIPKSIRFAEAPAVGRSVLATARGSKGAQAYRQVAASIASSWR
jgi:chromosome partitioning protein